MTDRSKFEMLYRSPNLLIDENEWHVVVWRRGRSVTVTYRFRKPGRHGYLYRYAPWQRMDKWEGSLPKGLRSFFVPYRRSIEDAKRSIDPDRPQAWQDRRIVKRAA